jgi:hypothetical protein
VQQEKGKLQLTKNGGTSSKPFILFSVVVEKRAAAAKQRIKLTSTKAPLRVTG